MKLLWYDATKMCVDEDTGKRRALQPRASGMEYVVDSGPPCILHDLRAFGWAHGHGAGENNPD